MTVLEIFILVVLSGLLILAAAIIGRGSFKLEVHKKITNKTELDPVQLKIMESNLEELKRYNENAEKAAAEQTDTVRTIAEGIQKIMGVDDGTE